MGGALYIFTIDKLKDYEIKLKIQRFIGGSVMIALGLLIAYAYQEKNKVFWEFVQGSSYSQQDILDNKKDITTKTTSDEAKKK